MSLLTPETITNAFTLISELRQSPQGRWRENIMDGGVFRLGRLGTDRLAPTSDNQEHLTVTTYAKKRNASSRVKVVVEFGPDGQIISATKYYRSAINLVKRFANQ